MSSWRTHARWGSVAWGVVAALEAIVTYLSIAFPPERLSLVFAVSTLVSLLAAGLLATRPTANRPGASPAAYRMMRQCRGLMPRRSSAASAA